MFLERTNARGTYHIYIDHVPKVLKHGLYKYNNTTHYNATHKLTPWVARGGIESNKTTLF